MAAHSNNFIRVRLHFDYPPPAVVDCRMCWLLVDLNTCRVVADLESVIRQKFEYSRKSILSLFVEDCYLPHTESVYVVRDNDCVRVKVDCLAQVNGYSSCTDTKSENCRKRQRPTEGDGPGENGVNLEWKKKKRKKKNEESVEGNTKQATDDEKNKKSEGKKKRKKAKEKVPSASPKPAASIKKTLACADQPVKGTKKSQIVSSSDSSSSSSEEDEAPKRTSAQKPAPKKTDAKKTEAQKPAPKKPSSTPAAPKAPAATKPNQTKSHKASSSSSDSDSSSDEASPVRKKSLTSMTPKGRTSDNSKHQQAPAAPRSTNAAQKQAVSETKKPQDKPSSSDSEEEIKLVIRQPLQQPGFALGGQSSWWGRGRGQPRGDGAAEKGRGRGRGGFRGHGSNFEFSYNEAKEPSYQTDSLTNLSVTLQNEAEAAPKRDYSSMPLLAAPPPPGQMIAFKLLELTENYTPEVSDYKEGKILSFDPTTKQIELELLHTSQAPVEPGKFDLVYQNPDGSESVEYAVSRGSQVTERWDSLLEPRLIL